jgi:hypothetical protein
MLPRVDEGSINRPQFALSKLDRQLFYLSRDGRQLNAKLPSCGVSPSDELK